MIEKEKVSLKFIKKEPFTGSDSGMRFRLANDGNDKILATVWPEPYSYYSTDDSLKTNKTFPLNEEGRDFAVNWLNEQRGNF
ncbi:MAG: hypothetical protein IKQ83_03080 [Lachnospiraceae bacterium]|nr:hypothetical protein [Lachnospiraceae bacterium]